MLKEMCWKKKRRKRGIKVNWGKETGKKVNAKNYNKNLLWKDVKCKKKSLEIDES